MALRLQQETPTLHHKQKRMRIDASGNVLVGKTATGIGTVGAELKSTGELLATVNNDACAFLNRKSSDGDIAVFRKDNTTVGSIGTKSSLLTIGTGTTGLIFDSGQIYPWNTTTNAAIDASKDLGATGARFKDLHLSGTGYFGTSVGIGTSSPSTYDSRANNLVVGDSGDAGVTIFSGSTSNARLQFAPSGATGLDNGLIDYDNNNDSMSFCHWRLRTYAH